MKENKEITMLTQGFLTWLIFSLMTFSVWLVVASLIYFSLQYFNFLSPILSFLTAAVLAILVTGAIARRYLKFH